MAKMEMMGVTEKQIIDNRVRNWTELDLGSFLASIWRYRWFIIGVAIAFMVVTFIVTGFMTKHYTASVKLLPQPQQGSLGLWGQLTGIQGSSGIYGITTFERLYDKIVRSDHIINLVRERKWTYSEADEPVSLYQVFGLSEVDQDSSPDPKTEHLLTLRLRQRAFSFTREQLSGFMTLRVTMPNDPNLAADIANFIAEALDDFNRVYNVDRARQHLIFVEGRLHAVEVDLKLAEDALAEFQRNNRDYMSSPFLLQRFGELQREVTAQTSIWVELRRQLETAKIDEHKDTYSIIVLDHAAPPYRPSSPRRVMASGIGLFFGGFIAVFLILIREQYRAKRA